MSEYPIDTLLQIDVGGFYVVSYQTILLDWQIKIQYGKIQAAERQSNMHALLRPAWDDRGARRYRMADYSILIHDISPEP